MTLNASRTPDRGRTLVTDFDGTLTRHDFYRLLIDGFSHEDGEQPWRDFLSGKITHFEALRRSYAAAQPGEDGLLQTAHAMGLDDDLAESISVLRQSGWRVIIASAGSHWYIDRLLDAAGVLGQVEVHANPGRVVDGRLCLELPTGAPFFSPEIGVDKPAIVRAALDAGAEVAFAGDGPPDLEPALLVPSDLRFARGFLANELTRQGLDYRPYSRWADIAATLSARPT